MVLDHLCRVRGCVNPAHLEIVDNTTNILRGEGPTAQNARKTHCKRGHELNAENVRVCRGERICWPCKLQRHKDARKARSALAKIGAKP